MRFFITIKFKNRIYKESKIVFNKIKIYKGKKMQYFYLDDTKKYQLLVFYFDNKDIIQEKFAPYAQDQDKIAESFIYTIIETAYIILIYTSFSSKL